VITFKDPAHFTAKVPSTPPDYGVPVGALVQVFPDLPTPAAEPQVPIAAGTPAGAPSGAATAGAAPSGGGIGTGTGSGGGNAVAGASTSSQGATAASESSPASGGSTAMAVLSVVALIGAAGLFLASRRGRRPSAPVPPSATVRWPDEEKV
jgi:hypothetical protein